MRVAIRKPKEIRISLNNKGYYVTDLQLNKIAKKVLLHRLVAEAFIPNPDNKPTVNHKDGIKTNCTIFNLEWATYKENN
jgi:hypothetical protein